MTRRRWQKMHSRAEGDAGFGLMEAIVAGFVLLFFSTGIAGLIMSSLKTSKIDRMRVAASSLATREMEIVRNQFGSSDAEALAVVGAGLVTNPNPLSGSGNVVDGVSYTVTRSAAWIPAGTGVSACDGGGSVTYPSVRVAVEVTWPGMRGVQPVRTDSIVTPTKSLLNTAYSFVAVKVTRFDATPHAGRVVKAVGPSGTVSQVTDASGCAVFGLAAPGSHTFTNDEAGFVDYYNNPVHNEVRNVTAGAFLTFSVSYDRASSMDVTQTTLAGHSLPSPLPPLIVANSALPTPKRLVVTPTGPTTSVTGLPPYAQQYSVWAGTCADADPAATPTNKQVTTYVLTPGANRPDVVAELAPVLVSATPGAQVYAQHAGTACAGMGVLSLGTADAAGSLRTSLPYGSWSVYRSGGAAQDVVPQATGVTEVVLS